MAVDFKPHETTGKLARRWLTQSGTLSKAEQFFLDKWMTRRSVELRDTIARECIRLYEMGVFDDMPDMRIVPQIETIAQAGSRKFLVWAEKFSDSLPAVVRSGFRTLKDSVTALAAGANDPFADVVDAEEAPDYSPRFRYFTERRAKDGLEWKHAIVYAATVVMATADLKDPFDASFPSLEEATIFTFNHEVCHGALLARQTFNPIVAATHSLAPIENDDDFNMDMDWGRASWAALFSVQVPDGNDAVKGLEAYQELWHEYYADAGAALLHARAGYSSEYLVPLCNVREKGSWDHRTQPVLKELLQVLDFHPVVLQEKITSFDLHWGISNAIAPQIGKDVLAMMASSPALAMMVERALPALPDTSQVRSDGYRAMNDALGGQYPKAALFFAKLKDGPTMEMVAKAFPGLAVVSPAGLEM